MNFLSRTSILLVAAMAVACGSSDPASLCGELHDPTGLFCNSGTELIDLQSAEARARREVGEDALLVWVRASTIRLMDPDGFAESWRFAYRIAGDPDPDIARSFVVTAAEVVSGEIVLRDRPDCTAEEPLQTFDSRVVVPDAVRRLEQTENPVRLGETGNLDLWQFHPCLTVASPTQNAVVYGGIVAVSTLEYDDDGRFVELTVD